MKIYRAMGLCSYPIALDSARTKFRGGEPSTVLTRAGSCGPRRSLQIRAGTARHRRDETVAAPRDGLDAARRRPPAVERRAERRDLHEEVALCDRRPGPDGRHDLFLRDSVSPSGDQVRRGGGARAPRPQRGRRRPVVAPEQSAAGEVEPEVPQTKKYRMKRTSSSPPKGRRALPPGLKSSSRFRTIKNILDQFRCAHNRNPYACSAEGRIIRAQSRRRPPAAYLWTTF